MIDNRWFVAFPALVACTAVAVAQDKPDPREKLETAIPEAIRLLEAKDDVAFLKTFVAPDDLKMMTKNSSLEESAKFFRQINAPLLLKVLKITRDIKPELDADGKKATYVFKEEISGMKSITFFRVDKYWYIQN